ncbi:MAG: TldD/PmbA family protein [bacterium]
MNPNDLLKNILKKSVDQAEVFYSSSSALKIDVHDQKVESVDEIRDQGIGIRVIKNNKLGFAFTSDLDEDVLEETIEEAVANAENSEADENHQLPTANCKIQNKLQLFNDQIPNTPIKDKIALALEIETAAYQNCKRVKKTEKITYSDSESEIRIVNSHGLDVSYKSNSCGAVAQIIAVQDGEMEYGFGLSHVKKYQDLNPQAIGQEAAQRACQLLGAKTIKSQNLPIVLDPTVGIDLLEVLFSPLTAEAVQKGKSLFSNKIGQQVASAKIKIIDNGRLENALGTSPFDDEGVPTQETVLIENGKLQTYLYNTYSASKGKAKSTGNASRGGFSTRPGTGPTNFYISPNSKLRTPNSIIRSIKRGLLVLRVMGIHTANPISGEFSVGASGIMIENGELTHPVRGVTISGNLIDMLMRIEEVGSDLRFIGSTGAPTLLVADVSVGG